MLKFQQKILKCQKVITILLTNVFLWITLYMLTILYTDRPDNAWILSVPSTRCHQGKAIFYIRIRRKSLIMYSVLFLHSKDKWLYWLQCINHYSQGYGRGLKWSKIGTLGKQARCSPKKEGTGLLHLQVSIITKNISAESLVAITGQGSAGEFWLNTGTSRSKQI